MAIIFAILSLVLFSWLPKTCFGLGWLFMVELLIVSVLLILIFLIIGIVFRRKHGDRSENKLSKTAKTWLVIGGGLVIVGMIIAPFVVLKGYDIFQEFNQSDECLDRGGAWNYGGNYCEMYPERMIQNHIFDMTIPVPEREGLSVTFNDIKSISNADVAYGEFFDKDGMEKGSVVGYYWQIKKFAPNFFAMPFSVDYGGSVNLTYLGLFSWKASFQGKEIKYLDRYFLGDRVNIVNSIESINKLNKQGEIVRKIIIAYFDHGEEQALNEDSQESKFLQIEVIDNEFINPKNLSPEEKEKIHDEIIHALGKDCEIVQINIPLWYSTGYEADCSI